MGNERGAESSSLLSLHVVGAGIGESIILQIPHESRPGRFHWGVVDCYSASKDPWKNPTLRFLRSKKDLGACRLDFACVTHPHDDHLFGFWHLFASDDVVVEKFWRFPADDWTLLRAFRGLSGDFALHAEYPRLERELSNLLKYTKKHRKSDDPSRYRRCLDYNKAVYRRLIHTIDSGNDVLLEISSLAPSSKQLDNHADRLAACLGDEESPRKRLFDPTRYDREIHNLLSVVLLVRFGDTHIILGADAECDSWIDILGNSDREEDGVHLSCDVIKVSHHGSVDAFHQPAWEEHAARRPPVVIITPYQRGSSRLPDSVMRERFAGCASEVHVTSELAEIGRVRKAFKSNFLRRKILRHVAGSSLPVHGKTVRVDHMGHVLRVDDLTIE